MHSEAYINNNYKFEMKLEHEDLTSTVIGTSMTSLMSAELDANLKFRINTINIISNFTDSVYMRKTKDNPLQVVNLQ